MYGRACEPRLVVSLKWARCMSFGVDSMKRMEISKGVN